MSAVQIDNSLTYWDPKDIIVVTNFPWEYHGVKSLVVGPEVYSEVVSHGTSLSNKPLVITYLIEHGLVDDINWFHDWDIFQLAPLDLPYLDRDVGFVNYNYSDRIQLGSIFFKSTALDVFGWIRDGITRYKQNEEETTNILVRENFNNIGDRFRKLNATYNIGMRNLRTTVEKADKPLRIAHFPPYKPEYLRKGLKIVPDNLARLLNTKFSQMKNLMVYISPNKKFNHEHELMMEVQIENSFDLGWKLEDIILLTNFSYEYKDVKAIVGPDSLINKSYDTNKRGIINSKINAFIYLLENKIINEFTWFHDVDSFQLAPLDLPEIKGDLGVTCYGIYPKNRLTNLGKDYQYRINFGNVFFKSNSLDIFKMLLAKMDRDGLYEEDAMTVMYGENYKVLADRIQIMNQTYNIGMRCVRSNSEIADKPLKIAHFPPHNKQVLMKFSKLLPDKLFNMLYAKFISLY